jgi:hypothetical protein
MNARDSLRAIPFMGEAFLELLLARFKIMRRKGNHVLSGLQIVSTHHEISITGEQIKQAEQIGRFIRSVMRRTHWNPTCLVQSLAATRMLRRRGLLGQLYIGVKRGDDHQFGAHAWVTVGDVYVCGGRQSSDFKVISVYNTGS